MYYDVMSYAYELGLYKPNCILHIDNLSLFNIINIYFKQFSLAPPSIILLKF